MSEEPPIGQVSLLWFSVALHVVAGFAVVFPDLLLLEWGVGPTSATVGSYVVVPSIVVGIAAVVIDWEEDVDLFHIGNAGAAGAVAQGLVPGILTLLVRWQTWLVEVATHVAAATFAAWATAYVCATYTPIEFDADLSSLRWRR